MLTNLVSESRLWKLAETVVHNSARLGFVANHFGVVSVRTNDESCIVVRVVVREQTRRTVVLATRLQSRAIESFDLLAILGRESQVRYAGFSSVWYRHNEALPFGIPKYFARRFAKTSSRVTTPNEKEISHGKVSWQTH